jgi:hypothetical protein
VLHMNGATYRDALEVINHDEEEDEDTEDDDY